MFSGRFHWDTQTNRLTQLLAERRAQGAPVLDLTESNPTHAGLSYPAAVSEVFADPQILRYEPAPAGSAAARAAVSQYYAKRGHNINPERILLTASTSEAYAYLFKLLADPGDQVLVPRPSYPLFEFLATMESLEVLQYPLVYRGTWSIDMDALAASITGRTRALVLVNPNNPTGSYVKRDELAAIARIAREHGVAVVSDEVFGDYAFGADPNCVTVVADAAGDCLSFSMSGLSKAAGLPQVKLGWIVTGGPEALRREAMEKLEWIADTYLSVGTPVQCAAPRLLRIGDDVQRQIRERTAENLAHVLARLKGTAANALQVEAGWYLTLQVPRIRTEEEWTLHLLAHRDVLVQPGYFYDFETEAFLVISLLTAPAIFREGVSRLADSLT